MTRECSVEGCGRAYCARGLCSAHYKRVQKTGAVGSPSIRERSDPRPPEPCSVDGCEEMADGLGRCNGYCKLHYTRWRRHGDPEKVLTAVMPAGENNWRWSGDDASYYAVHQRLRVQRGRASNYTCACGEPAKHWSYNHNGADERTSQYGAYCADLTCYEARCVSCHKRADLSRLAGTKTLRGGA